jgi:hypothetical protein
MVNMAFNGWWLSWLWPIAGILFLPFTTLMYVLLAASGPLTIWGWLIVGLGVLLDLGSTGQAYQQRTQVPAMNQRPLT